MTGDDVAARAAFISSMTADERTLALSHLAAYDPEAFDEVREWTERRRAKAKGSMT